MKRYMDRVEAALLLLLALFVVPPWYPLSNASAQDDVPDFAVETAHIARVLELSPGMTVADVGAGDGRYSAFLADQVGINGHVYSTEVDPDNIRAIRNTLAAKANATVIVGRHHSTELPEQCCDRILLRRVFHHFQEPAAMLKSLQDSLKPGGMIAIVDFLRHDVGRQDATPEDHEHGVRIPHLIEHMERAGFKTLHQVDDWPTRVEHGRRTDFCVLFQRPA